jgi:hypothetical protein
MDVLGITWFFCRKDRLLELEKDRGRLSSRCGRATLVPGKERSGLLARRNIVTLSNLTPVKEGFGDWRTINAVNCPFRVHIDKNTRVESCCDGFCCVERSPRRLNRDRLPAWTRVPLHGPQIATLRTVLGKISFKNVARAHCVPPFFAAPKND